MQTREIIAGLMRLGIPEDDARVYVSLLEAGPSKASAVADRVGVGRTKAYRVLDNLTRGNLATASLTRPTVYEARPPEDLFRELRARTEGRLRQLSEAKGELLEPLAALERGNGGLAPRNRWRILQGRPRALRVVGEVLERAEREFDVLSSRPNGVEDTMEMQGLRRVGREKLAAGLRTRALYHTTAESRRAIRERHGGAPLDIRHFDAEDLAHFVLADGREAVLWLVVDPSRRFNARGDVALWTDATELVSTLRLLFDFAWSAGTPLDAFED